MTKPSKTTLRELLENRSEENPQKTYLFFEDLEVSYQQMKETAYRVGNSLLGTGIKKGTRVALLLPNCPEFIYAFFGIGDIGAVAVPINPALKGPEIQYILNHAEARILITLSKFVELIKGIKPECRYLEQIFVVGEPTDGGLPFSKLLEGSSEPPSVSVGPDDEAALIYTSGTTGRPKGVILTHWNYVFNSYQLSERAQMNQDDRFLCILPLFHVNAQVVTTFSPLFTGASMILMREFSPKTFLPALSKYKATAFSGVPTVYSILLNIPGAEEFDLSSLRFCICGAAPMPVEVFKRFEEKFNAYILEGYGLSEGTCGSCVNPFGGKRKIGSIGIPLIGQEMKIFDDQDKEVPTGSIGEIVVKGENVMNGYFKNPEATKESLKNGWLHTGDLGYCDEDGYFFIVGRKKEMIIRGGENIYPREAEEVLHRHPAVLEAAVIGLPDKTWGEKVVAYLVLKENKKFAEEEVIAYCKENLADYKCPQEVKYVDAFPKTATGKVQKHELAKLPNK